LLSQRSKSTTIFMGVLPDGRALGADVQS